MHGLLHGLQMFSLFVFAAVVGGVDWLTRLANQEKANAVNDDTTSLAANAIQITQGVFHITKGSAAAYTLRAPISGLPNAGGEDGNVLRIVSATAFAHVVTTPSNKLNGNKLTATFAAAVGNGIELHAKGGIWLVFANQGVTLT
jgi:hypothetical protein